MSGGGALVVWERDNGGPTTAYAYDQRNLLAAATLGGQPTAEYVYDGAGNRLQQVDHTGAQPVTTTYANDILGLSQVLAAADGTNQLYNLFGLDLIHQDDGSQTLTLLADGLGSVRLQMADLVIQSSTTYEPYGNLLARSGVSTTTYGFAGEQHDNGTGLLYLRARYYSPELRGFTGKDPFSGTAKRPISYNGYAYGIDNPVLFVDPTGRWVCALESYIFNPCCDEWVEDALNKLGTRGGVLGQRLATFFERHDLVTTLVGVTCLGNPLKLGTLLGGSISGVRIHFNPVPPLIRAGAFVIPPTDIFLDSSVINGADADLADVATFGHEISHLAQGRLNFFSVHAEMLSAIVGYRLEEEFRLGRHHFEGVYIRDGWGPSVSPRPMTRGQSQTLRHSRTKCP
ncbi:MAG: RHS repeat-associated core domain-containing protein [Candidatus Promineifilaceae bacterium]